MPTLQTQLLGPGPGPRGAVDPITALLCLNIARAGIDPHTVWGRGRGGAWIMHSLCMRKTWRVSTLLNSITLTPGGVLTSIQEVVNALVLPEGREVQVIHQCIQAILDRGEIVRKKMSYSHLQTEDNIHEEFNP